MVTKLQLTVEGASDAPASLVMTAARKLWLKEWPDGRQVDVVGIEGLPIDRS